MVGPNDGSTPPPSAPSDDVLASAALPPAVSTSTRPVGVGAMVGTIVLVVGVIGVWIASGAFDGGGGAGDRSPAVDSYTPGPAVLVDVSQPRLGTVNGVAFDRATLDLTNVDRLIVPTAAAVEIDANSSGGARTATFYLAKRLGYAGPSAVSLTPDAARLGMGVAFRPVASDPRAIEIGVFGEWDAPGQGGARVGLRLVVTGGVVVVARADGLALGWRSSAGARAPLGAPPSIAVLATSRASQWKPPGSSSSRSPHGWLPEPNTPAIGWTRINDVPDPGTARAERTGPGNASTQ